ncbi:MAG: hypothetical protein M3R45_11390 [Pseudomonadota bacterium]|nr:hypothetical protein [Pseudomonadota bacterium]
MKRVFAIIATCGLALPTHAACYRVYNAGMLIHQSSDAPIDTTYEFHKTVPQRFGQGSTLVYESGGEDCLTANTPLGVARAYSNQAAGVNAQPRPKADRG